MSNVSGLLWSPPGPAKHRRSILGVLTTNLVLSLWESTSDPKEPGSWKRITVINNLIGKYFEQLNDDRDVEESRKSELTRLRKRIRTFSWSKACRLEGKTAKCKMYEKWGVPVLAVTNDNNEIIFIHILRPDGRSSGAIKQWHTEVLGHLKASGPSEAPSLLAPSSLLEVALKEQRFILQLSWSPWTASEHDGAGAILAYLVGNKLRFRGMHLKLAGTGAAATSTGSGMLTLHIDDQDLDMNNEQISRAIFTGPLRWYREVCAILR